MSGIGGGWRDSPETAITEVPTGQMQELPDDSGEWGERCELPDDSGEWGQHFELPDDSGEWNEGYALPETDAEQFSPEEVAAQFQIGVDTQQEAEYFEETKKNDAIEENEYAVLTDEEETLIKAETGWSDEIIDHITSMEQYEVYKNAGLHEAEVNGRKSLIKDIDLDYVDPKTEKTNRELMAEGKSPIDAKTGEKIELHHMGQDFNGPFAELCENSEHGDGNDTILHDKGSESWRQDPEKKNQYNNHDRPDHWKAHAEEGQQWI